MSFPSETAEERRARRARKEAEIKAKLAAEAKALNDAMFSGPVVAGQRQRDMERGAGAAGVVRAAERMAAGAAGAAAMNAAAAAAAPHGFAAAGRFFPPEPARRRWIAGGQGWREERRAAAVPGQQQERPRPLPTGREMVACPTCFRPIPQAEMGNHSESCPGRGSVAAGVQSSKGGEDMSAPSAAQKGDAEEGNSAARNHEADSSFGDTADRRRAMAASAAERRMQMQQATDNEPSGEEGVPKEADAPAAAQSAPLPPHEAHPAAPSAPPSLEACVICMDPAEEAVAQGILCPAKSHYTCAECFTGHVTAESLADPGLLARRRGRVLCPLAQHGCVSAPYAHTAVARAVTEEVFDAYMAGCERCAEQRAIAGEAEARAAGAGGAGAGGASGAGAGGARGGEVDGRGLEGAMAEMRRHIVDNILTLCCPRCGQAFLDFDGCCALSCPRCRCAFCAYCQEDCGTDSAAHNHVPRCPWNARKEVFSKKERFEEAQRERRMRSLIAFLGMLDVQTRLGVLEMCRADIEGVGIALDDIANSSIS